MLVILLALVGLGSPWLLCMYVGMGFYEDEL